MFKRRLLGDPAHDASVSWVYAAVVSARDRLALLTGRERDALSLLADGMSNEAIASHLFVSVKTVETWCARIFRKLDLYESPLLNRRVVAALLFRDSSGRESEVPRHNLVSPVTSMVGREEEAAELAGLVASGRFVSVIGPGGLGKTRLVVEYGLAHAEEWRDGVWFVDLAPVTDPSAIAQAVASAVRVPVGERVEVATAVIEHLRDREAVVIIDNCEHLAHGPAVLIDAVLRQCPGVRVLATSREPLGLQAERVWRPGALHAASAGVELFCARAGRGHLEASQRAEVVELCARLDGLPLAIELAAARVDVLSPRDILAGLDDQHGLLRSRDPTLGTRHRSVHDLIEWSYRLLTSDEQLVFRSVGVLPAGFDLAAATAVGEPVIAASAIGELVRSLQAKSLVGVDRAAGSNRFRMLDTIRSFAHHELDRTGELATVALRLGRHYMLLHGPQVHRLDPRTVSERGNELDNLRFLVALLASNEPELAQTIAAIVVRHGRRFGSLRDSYDEGSGYVRSLSVVSPAQPLLLLETAIAAVTADFVDEADALVAQAEDIATTAGLPDAADGEIERVRGLVALHRGDPSTARSVALAGLERVTTAHGRGLMYHLSCLAARDLGRYDEAYVAAQRYLQISVELGDQWTTPAFGNLAEVAWRAGDATAAAAHQLESLAVAKLFGDHIEIAYSMVFAARIAARSLDWPTAARLQTAANTFFAKIGWVPELSDRTSSDDLLASAAEHIEPGRYRAALRAGEDLPMDVATFEAECLLASITAPDTQLPETSTPSPR